MQCRRARGNRNLDRGCQWIWERSEGDLWSPDPDENSDFAPNFGQWCTAIDNFEILNNTQIGALKHQNFVELKHELH